MTAIDVNSARSRKSGDAEENAVQTNVEAAVEIARRSQGKANIGIVSKVQLMRAHSVCAEGGTGAVLRTDEGDATPEDDETTDPEGDDCLVFESDGERIVQVLRVRVTP